MLFFPWSFVYSLLFWWLICSGHDPVYTELEDLEAVLDTQELFAFESVDTSECLLREFHKSVGFHKPAAVKEIEQRKLD